MDRPADRRPAVGGARPRLRAFAPGLLAALVVLAVLLRVFVAEPFGVPSESMAPTLRAGDHVVVNKLAYRLGEPRRGDLVVFHGPGHEGLMLKRVVALGGQHVAIEDGVLHVDGVAVAEPFVDTGSVDSVYFGPVRVPLGTVFVMGDRRADSLDSRTFGAISRRRVVGRVDARVWPPRAVGGL